ncbi:MAG: OmpA family protein [Spirochaetaceae bacterium]|nr:OmpA family protein [Spirochaetaceae bacterium]
MTFGRKMAVFAAAFIVTAVSGFSQTTEEKQAWYIIFPANSADLQKITGDTAIRNAQSFTKVAQALLENPQYRILVDGHANPVMKTASEETGSLRPLSVRRAEAAADFLVKYYGVDRERLILTGAGGGYPFGTKDPSLDRRVSFFVITPR